MVAAVDGRAMVLPAITHASEWNACRARLYATRHTFITLALAAGADIFPLAKYVGSSVPMIQNNYAAWIIRDEEELLSRIAPTAGAKTRSFAGRSR